MLAYAAHELPCNDALMPNLALIAGALGVVGRAFLEHLETLADWEVVALSRRAPDFPARARFITVDLADADDCKAKLHGLVPITHLFYAAYAPRPTLAEEARHNTVMLTNLVEIIEPQCAGSLVHVQIMQGSKWYGSHLGPFKTPAKEDDPSHLPPNFYWEQQAWLSERQRGKRWTWSALRPHGVCGLSIGSSMNQLTAVALYATLSKHFGLPLRWPGRAGAFTSIYQLTEAAYLARGMAWAATTRQCANQAFNFTNGDFIRWCHLWPKVAHFFRMETGPVQTISLEVFMADKESAWAAIRARQGLRDYTLAQLTNWRFADFAFGCEYDQMSDMTKARNAGWAGANGSEAMYIRLLTWLRKQRMIP
jgi:nucleoside-diphosphate-sugar epimerase